MQSKQRILELVSRLEDLTACNEDSLLAFIVDLKFAISEIFNPASQYLSYLKFVKIRPDAAFVTDKERERSWQDAVAQIDNLLRVIINDPQINGNAVSASYSSDLGRSIHSSSDPALSMEEAVGRSLENFKETVDKEYPSLQEDGPIKEPLRGDSVATTGPLVQVPSSDGASQAQEDKQKIESVGRVLCVPGSDQLVNNEVITYLERLPATVMSIPKAVGYQSLIDRLNQCASAEFLVFILSADFHAYSRGQRPVDASLVASQAAAFQLVFLVAKFDRQKIVVLYNEEDEFLRPTEFFDLFYIPITPSGAWKEEVVRRIKGKRTVPAGLGLSLENQPRV